MATWLSTFLIALIEKVLLPLFNNWIKNHEIAKTVQDLQTQLNQTTKDVIALQSAVTPQEAQDDIKKLAADDNAGAR